MAKRKKQTSAMPDTIDGPAMVPPGNIYEFERASPKLGRDAHVRNFSHPLDLALRREKISDAQWAAGDAYRRNFLLRERSGVDSSQGSSGGSSGTPWTQAQVDAIRRLQKIDAGLSRADRLIARAFCCEGHSMVEALRRADVPFCPHGVLPRIQEALDSVGRAIISCRKKSA